MAAESRSPPQGVEGYQEVQNLSIVAEQLFARRFEELPLERRHRECLAEAVLQMLALIEAFQLQPTEFGTFGAIKGKVVVLLMAVESSGLNLS